MNNIPTWLRWVLILPASILAMALVHFAIVFFGGWSMVMYTGEKVSGIYEHYLVIVAATASGASFVHYGAEVAPKHHDTVVYVLTSVCLFFTLGAAILHGLSTGAWWDGWDTIGLLATMAGASGKAYSTLTGNDLI